MMGRCPRPPPLARGKRKVVVVNGTGALPQTPPLARGEESKTEIHTILLAQHSTPGVWGAALAPHEHGL